MIPVSLSRKHDFAQSGRITWVILIEDCRISNSYDTYFRTAAVGTWHTRPSTSVGSNSRIPLGGIDEIAFSVDPNAEGGIAETAKASFRLDFGTGLVYESFISTYNIDGKTVSFWIHAPEDDDTTFWSDAEKVWEGVIVETGLDGGLLKVECEGREVFYHKQIPTNLFKRKDTTAFDEYAVPEALNGTPIPMVFGAVKHCQGYVVADTHDTGTVDAGRKAKFCDVVTSHAIESMANIKFGAPGLVEANGGYAKVYEPGTGYTLLTSAGEMYFDDLIDIDDTDPTIQVEFEVWPRSWIAHGARMTGVTGNINAIDGDLATYCSIPAATDPTTDAGRNWFGKIPELGISGTILGGSMSGANIWALFKLTTTTGYTFVSTARWEGWGITYNRGINNGVFTPNAPTYGRGWASNNANSAAIDNTDPDSASRYSYQMNDNVFGYGDWDTYKQLATLSNGYISVGNYTYGTGSGATGTMNLYAVGLLVRAEVPYPDDDLYAEMEGYQDDGSAHYTGVAYRLIENPADLIAFIWCRLTDCWYLDYAANDLLTSRAARSGWKLGRQILERKSTKEYLDEIAKTAFMWTWIDRDGDVRMFPLTPKSGYEDFYTIRPDDVVGNIEAAYQQESQNVQTDFVVKYKWNPVADDYDGMLFCNADESSPELGSTYEDLCQAAKDTYCGGREREADDIELPWVEDDDTALAYAQAVIARRTTRPWIVEWISDLGRLFWLEPGDVIEFYDSPLWSGFMPSAARTKQYRITGVTFVPEAGQVRFVATEVLSNG